MDFEDRFRNQEAEIRQLKSDLLKFEIEKDGLKSLTTALKERILELQGTGSVDDIEIKTLKNENTKLQLKCVNYYQEREDALSLNYMLSEELKRLQETMGVVPNVTYGEVNHGPCVCDSCGCRIKGIRYKCGHCPDFDLCSLCEGTFHNQSHIFIKIKRPISIEVESDVHLLPEFRFRTTGTSWHSSVKCDLCGKNPIAGIRYKCGHCTNFDICAHCEMYSNDHDPSHSFLKITKPIISENELYNSSLLPTFATL